MVKLLIIVGIVSLIVIFISNVFFWKIALKFTSKSVLHSFCEQDYRGNYILAKNTSYEVCKKVANIADFINPSVCESFNIGEEKNACLGLVEIAINRTNDCLTLLSGKPKTSVNPADVEKYCKTINVTIS